MRIYLRDLTGFNRGSLWRSHAAASIKPDIKQPAAGKGKKNKKKGGCLKGCLVVILVMFLIAGARG